MVEYGEAGRQISVNPRKGMEAAVGVMGLPGEHLGEVAGLLAHCFHASFVDLFPNEGARSHALPRMFATGLRDAKGTAQVGRGLL